MWTCDKCGCDVKPENDAVDLEFIIQHGGRPDPFSKVVYGARHLLPVGNCEGSPSRVQYLRGQPRDARGFPYVGEREASVRAAYARLKQRV